MNKSFTLYFEYIKLLNKDFEQTTFNNIMVAVNVISILVVNSLVLIWLKSKVTKGMIWCWWWRSWCCPRRSETGPWWTWWWCLTVWPTWWWLSASSPPTPSRSSARPGSAPPSISTGPSHTSLTGHNIAIPFQCDQLLFLRLIPIVVVIFRMLMICHVDFCHKHGEKVIRDQLLR